MARLFAEIAAEAKLPLLALGVSGYGTCQGGWEVAAFLQKME